MVNRIAVAVNIIGILVAIGPTLLFCVTVIFLGGDTGSIALVGGEGLPTTVLIPSKLSKVVLTFSIAAALIFSFNIYALRRRLK